ncbi:MAG: hypothetical protein ACD_22C00172G0010 [uncultured bacterium]|uniref:PpiC domain-containing protein n=1 Tax=candidate division WWE3 bacterium RBG_16_37_10 TaxID=1802610 RepID=A0A1F4V1G0_UNCKA|nr:MAG: hypothetical protein ACD_22C00172G0010 [uncultured bacterium]OGC51031.1 MAG: hypothetical protein A2W32_01710 [candidate division WWE3 bacterium RBG_16_37_10]
MTNQNTNQDQDQNVSQEVNTQVSSPKIKLPKIKLKRKSILLALVAVLLLVGVYYFKGLIVAATVNYKPIFRLTILKEAEKAYGQAALDNMIVQALVEEELSKQNIEVTQAEIDEQIAIITQTLTSQGTTLDAALKERGLTKKELVKQIKIQKQAEKLLTKDITVSDEEIDQYIEANSKYLPEGEDPVVLRAQITEQLKQEKVSSAYQTWIDGLRQKAKIYYFVNYGTQQL